MSKERKLRAEIKRIELAKDFNKKIHEFYADEQKRHDPDTAWQNAISRLDRYIFGLTKQKPQEQNIIIQAVRKLESAFERVRAGEGA